MKKTIVFLALSFTLGGASSGALSAPSFFDDFNRPDSQVVGNGWTDVPDIYGNHLSIKDGQLTTTASFSGISRSFTFGGPISMSLTLAETSGYGGLPNRYIAEFGILGSSTTNSSYRISLYRGDQNYSNSQITLLDGADVVATFMPLIQFGHLIDVNITFGVDGSVKGVIGQQSGQSESFSFGARNVLSSGSDIILGLGAGDGAMQHRLDNFQVTTPIPEPETYAMLLAGLSLLAFAARCRQRKSVQA